MLAVHALVSNGLMQRFAELFQIMRNFQCLKAIRDDQGLIRRLFRNSPLEQLTDLSIIFHDENRLDIVEIASSWLLFRKGNLQLFDGMYTTSTLTRQR